MIYLVNLSEEDFKRKKNKWLAKIKKFADENMEGLIIPYSASYEKELFEASLNKEESKENSEEKP